VPTVQNSNKPEHIIQDHVSFVSNNELSSNLNMDRYNEFDTRLFQMARKHAIYNFASSLRVLEGTMAHGAKQLVPVQFSRLQVPRNAGLTSGEHDTNTCCLAYVQHGLLQPDNYLQRFSSARRLWSHGYQIGKHRCMKLLHLAGCHPAGIKGQRPQVLQVLQVFEACI
jgi:hypothetical protein